MKTMINKIRCLLAMLLWLMPLALSAQEFGTDFATPDEDAFVRDTPDGYYMELMDVDVTVHADRTYDIVENLDVYFVLSSHGLYRDIPTRFWVNRDISAAQDGSEYQMRYNRMKIDEVHVSENFETDNTEEDLLSLRIGSYDVELQGKHHYRIGYRLKLPNDRVEASDLFFHSVVGSAWNCSIDSVHFTVHFDKEIPEASLAQLNVYSGREGDGENRASDFVDYQDCHTIEGSACNFPRYWGLTLYLPLPEGYFPTDDYPIWTYLVWALLIVTVVLLAWVAYYEWEGDEPVAPVVSFHPDADLNSADVGSLIDGDVDDVDLLSMIPWFASHGYLAIEQRGNSTILRKLCPLPESAPAYQTKLFDAFFDDGDTFDLKHSSASFGREWLGAMSALRADYHNKLNVTKGFYTLLLASFTLSLAYCLAQVEPDGWVMGGLINFALFCFMVVCKLAQYLWKNKISFSSIGAAISSVWMLVVFGGIIVMGLIMLLGAHRMFDDYYVDPNALLGVMVAFLLTCCFIYRLKRMTPYRRQRLAEVMGLRQFIQTAEEDRLRMLLDENESYFYDILPFAMAFGLVDKWAAKFQNLPVQERPEFGYAQPSNITGLMNTRSWGHTVNDSVSRHHAVTAAKAGSRAVAGAARGGYSGGGSGGGGGRRW